MNDERPGWQICRNCAFSQAHTEVVGGQEFDLRLCRYNPPASNNGCTSEWPIVFDSDWCGRWKSRLTFGGPSE